MFDEAFIERTIACWQPYYERPLSQEDALIIIERFGALLDLLERWAREEAESFYRQYSFWAWEDAWGEDDDAWDKRENLW